jgi:hypothetical protein
VTLPIAGKKGSPNIDVSLDLNRAWEQVIEIGKSISSGWGAHHHNDQTWKKYFRNLLFC